MFEFNYKNMSEKEIKKVDFCRSVAVEVVVFANQNTGFLGYNVCATLFREAEPTEEEIKNAEITKNRPNTDRGEITHYFMDKTDKGWMVFYLSMTSSLTDVSPLVYGLEDPSPN